MASAAEGGMKVSGVSIGKIEDVPHWLLECDAWCTEQTSPAVYEANSQWF